MPHLRRFRGLALALALTASTLTSSAAFGQSATDSAAAEALFNEALTLLTERRPAEACIKLEESQRLDPGVGTLLYLADCYQQLGRTASAWATFREAAYMAKDQRDEREATAIELAQALEGQLSQLTLEVSVEPGVDIRIEHDGKPVNEALWGTPFPVDPGQHEIVARADGKRPWSKTLDIGPGPVEERVVVPRLEDLPPQAPAPPPVAAPAEPAVPTAQASDSLSTVGWVLVGVGGAGVVGGAVLALLARGDDSEADAQCRPDRPELCDPKGVDLSESARTKATLAGVSAGVGLAALGAGVTLLLTAGGSSEQPSNDAIALDARWTRDGGFLSLAGAF